MNALSVVGMLVTFIKLLMCMLVLLALTVSFGLHSEFNPSKVGKHLRCIQFGLLLLFQNCILRHSNIEVRMK